MAAWNLYRHHNSDGSSKDWAVRSNSDGSITTRWGKTADRLPGVSNRYGLKQPDIERQKQAKGYVLVAEVDIDVNGNVVVPGKTPATSSQLPEPDANPESVPAPPVEALYWTIDCHAKQSIRVELGIEIERLIGVIQSVSDQQSKPEQDWDGWQQLIDTTLNAETFELSGQIKSVHGVLPWLFLLALKAKGFKGADIDIATETARDLSADLKAEQDVLAFFGTDLDSIRETAEILGLLKPRLNLAAAMSDTDDCWF
ncbi:MULTISPECIES: hypothetical protein [Methylomonas]|uniref:Uncharacterized protein n=1 Tax=Methylomonas methanica TaxID=421 RepID=A0A177MMT6_METMH|nr:MULTISPECIES: hypothetical protein [Methylomonas]OAI06704.1 hypothetical protein A1353_00130 [Methylomonas methanica]PKM13741.1 MAG: hypothetical protein CVV13_00680 [Gammaproteobacteria bacterium HGW-Gammaproteobacteria-3]QBC26563.1 hypothetical protein U737_06350 [Methylomonas sp. LW13]